MKTPELLGHNLYVIDDYDLNRPGRTGTFVLVEEKITLIETCASPSIPHILKGLADLQINVDDVAYIIVTHIHLDHAGGAGLLMQHCKRAKLIVHPRGMRHLIDPTKLIQGAQAVYGAKFDALFSPILPISPERIIAANEGDTLKISEKRTLTFYDTPGHAEHHISILDSVTNGIFTGDTVGIFYRELMDLDVEFYLPSTSPSQFNPDAMLHSLHRIHKLGVHHIYFSHYGKSSHVRGVCRQIESWLPHFISVGSTIYGQETDAKTAVTKITKHLFTDVQTYLTAQGVPQSHPVYEVLHLDLHVCAMGIVDYIAKASEMEKA